MMRSEVDEPAEEEASEPAEEERWRLRGEGEVGEDAEGMLSADADLRRAGMVDGVCCGYWKSCGIAGEGLLRSATEVAVPL